MHYFPLDSKLAAAIHLPAGHGLLVGAVDDKSPAALAGISKSDVILALAGKSMASAADLQTALGAISAGTTVPIQIWRAGQELDLKVQF